MDKPGPAQGLEQAFREIVAQDSRATVAAALDCHAWLGPVAFSFRKLMRTKAREFGRGQLTRELVAVENACNTLSSLLKNLDPVTLELIGLVPASREFVENEMAESLGHWDAAKARKFFPVQDYHEPDFSLAYWRLVPHGKVPEISPMALRLGHVAALMRELQKVALEFKIYEEPPYSPGPKDTRFIGKPKNKKPELAMMIQCGKILLMRGHGLPHLVPIARAIYTWSEREKPPDGWGKRDFTEARKAILGWWEGKDAPVREEDLPF